MTEQDLVQTLIIITQVEIWKKVSVDKYLIRFRIEYLNLSATTMGYMISLSKVTLA